MNIISHLYTIKNEYIFLLKKLYFIMKFINNYIIIRTYDTSYAFNS